MLKVTRYGKTHVVIEDYVDGEVEQIYGGPPDVSCIIEAMGFYYGEDDIEHEDKEAGETCDPLNETEYEVTDNTEVEFINTGDLFNTDNNEPCAGEDYPDDD